MKRGHYFVALLLMFALLIGVDLAVSQAPDAFNAPAIFALGSGEASSGAHCTSL